MPAARAVAWVGYDGEVAQALHNGDGADVHGVAGIGLEGADAPLAEDDPVVAAGHDVLGGEQQLLQEDREPPPLDLAALRQEMAALRQAAVWLGRREVAHLRSFARPAALVEQPIDVETSLADLRLDSLAEAYRLVLARQLPPTVPVASDPYPLEQMLAQLRDHLTDRPSLSFQELLDRYQDRRQQVACFLALLELARRGEVTAQQQRLWGDILIERRPRFLGRSTTDST